MTGESISKLEDKQKLNYLKNREKMNEKILTGIQSLLENIECINLGVLRVSERKKIGA